MTLHVRVRPRRGIVIVAALALVASLLMTPAGAYPRPGATERVSVASDGTQGDQTSYSPALSADGRHVAFASSATTLVPGDTNKYWDVFVHDRATGATERVSVASDGTEGDSQSPHPPAISADGRYIAFDSFASNLVPGDTNDNYDVFMHDRTTGITERVSVASDGTQGNGSSTFPALSPDGRHVAFSSTASNLVPGDTNNVWDVFVHDRATGITERVSVASDGTEGNQTSGGVAISADGRHVAFSSIASNLVPGDTNDARDVFVHDRATGITERVSVASDGTEGNDASYSPALSADGRHVAFASGAFDLVPGDTNGAWDVFVHDRATGTTERVSVASDGTEGNNLSQSAHPPAISADGRHVAFDSLASNLVPDDTNNAWDAFVHDRATGTTERVSVASDGTPGNQDSSVPTISADGRHVALPSSGSNLVLGDTNLRWDVFVRNRGPATGIGSLAAQSAEDELMVSGWATFSGATVASAEDPDDDGEVGARELGAEITAASVTYRTEHEDLLLRMGLASLPGPAVGGAPGVLYRWAFAVGGSDYEVRALRAAATAMPPAAPHFAVYECSPTCTEAAPLSGGIGTTGAEVRASLPLEVLGMEEGTTLTAVKAFATLGEATPGEVVVLDELDLPDASIPLSRVELGIAPPSTPQADVAFSAQADLMEGRFSATLDASSLPPGAYRVWARACLGQTCGAALVDVVR